MTAILLIIAGAILIGAVIVGFGYLVGIPLREGLQAVAIVVGLIAVLTPGVLLVVLGLEQLR